MTKQNERQPTHDRWNNKIIFSEAQIQRRVHELGQEITNYYKDSPRNLVIIGMLKGSLYFIADLTRAIDLPLTYDFTSIATTSMLNRPGIIRISRQIGIEVNGKDVLIVEEVIRTGLTTNLMVEYIETLNPATLKICTLLYNPDQILIPLPVEFVGFNIDYNRVVGYGIDLNEQGRTFKDIVKLDANTVFPK
ncbi:MAG: phosphoribosyltransferase [Fastidiosipilaceae bacterium]|nr:hypoxanthine phosphoribosyltransferase [Clostridiaceae bacterium]